MDDRIYAPPKAALTTDKQDIKVAWRKARRQVWMGVTGGVCILVTHGLAIHLSFSKDPIPLDEIAARSSVAAMFLLITLGVYFNSRVCAALLAVAALFGLWIAIAGWGVSWFIPELLLLVFLEAQGIIGTIKVARFKRDQPGRRIRKHAPPSAESSSASSPS